MISLSYVLKRQYKTSISLFDYKKNMKKIKESDKLKQVIEIDDDDDPNQTIIIEKTYNVPKKHHFDPLRTVPYPFPFKPPGQKMQFRLNPRYYKVMEFKKREEMELKNKKLAAKNKDNDHVEPMDET